jgi:hypothetical protein
VSAEGAADRLARTRLAIIDQIHRRDRRRERGEPDDEPGADLGEASGGGFANRMAGFKRALVGWWRQQPASMGLELATPLLSEYASKRPGRFLAIAAATGAVVMVARPWRLISATGLLVALLKSSQLSGLLMAALSAADSPRNRPPHR